MQLFTVITHQAAECKQYIAVNLPPPPPPPEEGLRECVRSLSWAFPMRLLTS